MACSEGSSVTIQKCKGCGRHQYPSREFCSNCLGDELSAAQVDPAGTLLTWTRLHFSFEKQFSDRLPVTIGQVLLSCGARIICFLDAEAPRSGEVVQLRVQNDQDGRPVFFAK